MDAGEKIKYCDVTSLYPWVCKYGMFPLGAPTVITEDFAKIDKDNKPYKGLFSILSFMFIPIDSNSVYLQA